MPPWRNWIARWTSNPKVASSSLVGGAFLLSRIIYSRFGCKNLGHSCPVYRFGVVVIASPLHGEGHEFNPRNRYRPRTRPPPPKSIYRPDFVRKVAESQRERGWVKLATRMNDGDELLHGRPSVLARCRTLHRDLYDKHDLFTTGCCALIMRGCEIF